MATSHFSDIADASDLASSAPHESQLSGDADFAAGFAHAVALAALAQRWEQCEDLGSLLASVVGEGRAVLNADGVAILRLQGARWLTVAASDTVTRRAADVHASFKGLARTRSQRERVDPDVEDFNVLRRTRRHLRAEGSGRLALVSLALAHPTFVWGALNVYLNPNAISPTTEALITLYAQHAGVALIHAGERETLRHGVAVQRRIGQAQGILMVKHGITPEIAFERLVRVSKQTNVTVPVAADHVVLAQQPGAGHPAVSGKAAVPAARTARQVSPSAARRAE